jgi:hypothetical protein
VDLGAGDGEAFWPCPGRTVAACRGHTFAQLATAIEVAFVRWDRSHLHEFTRADGYRLGILSDEDDDSEHLLVASDPYVRELARFGQSCTIDLPPAARRRADQLSHTHPPFQPVRGGSARSIPNRLANTQPVSVSPGDSN